MLKKTKKTKTKTKTKNKIDNIDDNKNVDKFGFVASLT